MQPRDTSKPEKYFDRFIVNRQSLLQQNVEKMYNNLISEDNVRSVNYLNLEYRLTCMIAQYSRGDSMDKLKESIEKVIDDLPESWNPLTTKVKLRIKGRMVLSDQYMVEPYTRMLRIISLAYLLGVEDNSFRIIVQVVRQDRVLDKLFEFIFAARGMSSSLKGEEAYDIEKSIILKTFGHLRAATDTASASDAQSLVAKFLEKGFYHRHNGFYDFHKLDIDLYYGYWSFEAAAVSVILGLDDSVLRMNRYYPSDLAVFARSNESSKGKGV